MAENLQESAKHGVEAAKKTVDALKQKVPKDAIVDKSWQHFRTAIFLSYLVVAEVIFIVLAFLARTIAYFTFDVTITRAVQEIHAGWFDALMSTLTWIGF